MLVFIKDLIRYDLTAKEVLQLDKIVNSEKLKKYLIIEVDGYKCVAPLPLNINVVYPFDEDKVYPVQCAKAAFTFKIY